MQVDCIGSNFSVVTDVPFIYQLSLAEKCKRIIMLVHISQKTIDAVKLHRSPEFMELFKYASNIYANAEA